MKHSTPSQTAELKSKQVLISMGIEPDDYPADACFGVSGYEFIGTYSKDRKTVCIMMTDNPELDMLSKEMVKLIAYTCERLITDFGCEVHSVTMKDFKPFNTLTIEKVSNTNPTASSTEGLPEKLKAGGMSAGGTFNESVITDKDGHWVAKTYTNTYHTKEQATAIANELTRRYNAFPELVEALKPFAEMFGEFTETRIRQQGVVFEYNGKQLTVSDFFTASSLLNK